MRIRSQSFEPGQPISTEFAMGQADGFAGNRNPHLAWDDVPAGTRSFALLCIDPDAPTVAETVGREDMEIPQDQPRADFVHWTMIDIPADVREIAAGSCSDGVTARGKTSPPGPAGARQGLNDYTGWFAGDAQMGGDYLVMTVPIRRSTISACTAISSASTRWTRPRWICRIASPPPTCGARCRGTRWPRRKCMALIRSTCGCAE